MPKPKLERFVADYSEKAFHFAYKLSGNVEDAKELVQEAFVRIMRRWDRFEEEQSVESYFLSILRNLYFDGLRRYEKRHGCSLAMDDGESCEEDLADALSDGGAGLLDALERRDSQDRINAAFDALSPEHRAILSLSDVQGLSYEEIAAVLDCPGGTVRSRLSRARRAFKTNLAGLPEVMK